MPSIAPRVLEQLGLPYPYGSDGNGGPALLERLEWGAERDAAGRDVPGRLGSPVPLFPRLESEAATEAVG